jgi:hypothetical protein
MPADIPPPVAEALSRYAPPVRARLIELRELIFAVADETADVGPLTETLKWGEPAYLTEQSRSGTTIRLGAPRDITDQSAIYFNCRTTLVPTFRDLFGTALHYEGTRALLLPTAGPLPAGPLRICLCMALTYHRDQRRRARPS